MGLRICLWEDFEAVKRHRKYGLLSVAAYGRRALRFVAGPSAMCFLVALSCVSSGRPVAQDRSPDRDGGRALRSRAEQFWTARKARDCRTLFLFEDPTPVKRMDEATFVAWCENEDQFRISQHSITQVETAGDWGWVRVAFKAMYTGDPEPQAAGAEIPTESIDKWRRLQGQWYALPKFEWDTLPEAPSLRNTGEEERLRARFAESWGVLQAKDWRALYEFVDPADRVPVESFVAHAGATQYLGHELLWIEVIGDRGKVYVSYEHKPSDPSLTKIPSQKSTVTEFWISRDGEWYRDLKRS